MREALARSDLDFVLREPDGARRNEGGATRLPKILRMACISTAAVVCGVIVVNALFLQDRKHPAPLLRVPDGAHPVTADILPAPSPAPRPTVALSATPAPSPNLVSPRTTRDAIADEIAKASAPSERKVVRAPAANVSAKGDGERADPIGSLIGGTAPVAPEPSASVLTAQKALLRLGYVLRADGMLGATTKQAIERYERDNHLPVRGELTPKLSRELAVRSGATQ